MQRSFMSFVVLAAILAAACGGGDKEPAATAPAPMASSVPQTPMPPAVTPVTAASPTIAAAPTSNNAEGRAAAAGVFGALMVAFWAGGLAGNAPGPPAAQPAAAYLPPPPPSFKLIRDFTERSYGWTEDTTTMEVAGNIAQAGDPSVPSATAGLLLTAVFRPVDPQTAARVRAAFATLSEQDLREAISDRGRYLEFSVQSLRALAARDLGEGGVGFEMTVKTDDTSAQPFGASSILNTYRVYFFSRGAYIGGVVRIGYVDPIPEIVDDLGLAKIIDGKLKGAP